jgi:hypothetical protein
MSNKNPKFKVGGFYKRLQQYLYDNQKQDYTLSDEKHFLLMEKTSEKTSAGFKEQAYWIVSCIETGEEMKLSESAMRTAVKAGTSIYQN